MTDPDISNADIEKMSAMSKAIIDFCIDLCSEGDQCTRSELAAVTLSCKFAAKRLAATTIATEVWEE